MRRVIMGILIAVGVVGGVALIAVANRASLKHHFEKNNLKDIDNDLEVIKPRPKKK